MHLEAVYDDATALFGADALVLLLVRGVEPQIQELHLSRARQMQALTGWYVDGLRFLSDGVRV